MAKLLFDKGVVQERTDLNPVAGCWRVVFERIGEGTRLLQLLDEAEDFPAEKKGLFKGVFGAKPEYLVYAVSKERHLLLEFPRRVVHQNQANHFDLYFRIEYHVSDPKILVVRLRAINEDQLAQLRDTIGDEFSRACARIPWEIVKDEYAFNDVADSLTATDTELFRRLQSKAHDLGLTIGEIKLSLRLLEADVVEHRQATEHQRLLAQRKRDLEVTHADQDIEDVLKARELRRQTWDAGTQAMATSLGKIANNTDTAGELLDNLSSIGSYFSPQVPVPGPQAPALPEVSPKLISENASALPGRGLSLVQQVVGVVAQLDLREREKRELLSAIFHLAGELLAPGEAEPEALAHYRRIYQDILDRFLHELKTPQSETLSLLLNIERL